MAHCGKAYEAKCRAGCGENVNVFDFECGHVVAKSKGGEDKVDNLRPICSTCNKSMGVMNMEEYKELLQRRCVSCCLFKSPVGHFMRGNCFACCLRKGLVSGANLAKWKYFLDLVRR